MGIDVTLIKCVQRDIDKLPMSQTGRCTLQEQTYTGSLKHDVHGSPLELAVNITRELSYVGADCK